MLPKKKEESFTEKRKYKRFRKHFLLRYYDIRTPQNKEELTQLKNISQGGMCFVTTSAFPIGTHMGVELNTPFITGTTILEGIVRGSNEKVKNMIYETRLEFENLNTEALVVLDKLITFFNRAEGATHD
ncbi:MAG: PilZ domain-containing protein [Candidatus Omnitrophica bacterium]|nr:PilZ domain-containing protein [Candidatus Omnitrophota bacterium]